MAFEFPGYLDATAVSLVSWDLPRGVCGTCRTQKGDRKGWKLSLMLARAGFADLESLYWVRGLIKLFLNKHSFLRACLLQVKGARWSGGEILAHILQGLRDYVLLHFRVAGKYSVLSGLRTLLEIPL